MQCGAKTRSGKPCKSKPMENGRCRMHGGLQPKGEASPNFVHGRYSKYMRQSLQEKMVTVEDDNPLDLLPELNVQRALLAEYIGRFQAGVALGMGDIDALVSWSSDIGKMVERIVKMRNETALTAAEVALIAARIPEVVMKYLDDPDKQQRFISDLFAVVGQSAPTGQRQLAAGADASGGE